jgi:hypothetical protein
LSRVTGDLLRALGGARCHQYTIRHDMRIRIMTHVHDAAGGAAVLMIAH